LTDLPFAIAWSPTDSRPATASGLLTQFVTGDAAHVAAGMDERRLRGSFTRQLDTVYAEAAALATDNVSTMVWAHERYTGGGYAVYRPGQMAPFWPALRDGAGRIRFAGEHTESLAGYMESAIRSGHRIAKSLGRVPG
jgi:monoamine oxidase